MRRISLFEHAHVTAPVYKNVDVFNSFVYVNAFTNSNNHCTSVAVYMFVTSVSQDVQMYYCFMHYSTDSEEIFLYCCVYSAYRHGVCTRS